MSSKRPRSTHATPSRTLSRQTFGQRLRAARKKFGLTLAEVSESSGVSIPTISRAERGQLALSYEKFSALARALKMDLSVMFAEIGAKSRELQSPILTRSGKGVKYRGAALTYEFLATQATGKRMSPVLATVHAHSIKGPESFARHAGEEFVYVLSGALEIHFETGETVPLRRGDALYYDSSVGHALVSTSRRPARVIGTMTGESNHMRDARERGTTESPVRRRRN